MVILKFNNFQEREAWSAQHQASVKHLYQMSPWLVADLSPTEIEQQQQAGIKVYADLQMTPSTSERDTPQEGLEYEVKCLATTYVLMYLGTGVRLGSPRQKRDWWQVDLYSNTTQEVLGKLSVHPNSKKVKLHRVRYPLNLKPRLTQILIALKFIR